MKTRELRIARPVSDLAATQVMYCRGLGLGVIGRFEDHHGFDGVMLGVAGSGYHLEFTRSREHRVVPEWRSACADMLAAGFKRVAASNPYWDFRGCTYEDRDGYRVVPPNDGWKVEAP